LGANVRRSLSPFTQLLLFGAFLDQGGKGHARTRNFEHAVFQFRVLILDDHALNKALTELTCGFALLGLGGKGCTPLETSPAPFLEANSPLKLVEDFCCHLRSL